MRAREGDLIETVEGLIFDVKGLIHPPNRVIAFVRYFPDEKGERRKNGATYSKIYSLPERYALLRKIFPQYLLYDGIFDETLCEVQIGDVKRLHRPVEKLQELCSSRVLDSLERKSLQLAELLKEEANVPCGSIGISGSILTGLHIADSDIDLIVYGSQNCRKVYSVLERMFKGEHGLIRPYTLDDLRTLFDFRSKDSAADFKSFVRTESRKVMQGKFVGTDYFMRFVKDWDEVDENYGDVQYKSLGVARVRATIADDSDGIFTPCVYKVDKVHVQKGPKVGHVEEIGSFRGRFCEQARIGEVVIAQGKIEHVTDTRRGREYHRVLLGNNPSDFMILA
jgi:predicted nucleotidyltransferase